MLGASKGTGDMSEHEETSCVDEGRAAVDEFVDDVTQKSTEIGPDIGVVAGEATVVPIEDCIGE